MLILPHHDGHRPPPPIVNLRDGTDREAQITFREADDECAELVGCPECLSPASSGLRPTPSTRACARDGGS